MGGRRCVRWGRARSWGSGGVPGRGGRAVARETGLPLKLAGKKQDPKEIEYFAEYVEPHLVGGIEYIGEVTHGEKGGLFQDAPGAPFPLEREDTVGYVKFGTMRSEHPGHA